MVRFTYFIVTLVIAMLLSSCDDGAPNESRHPLYVKALNKKEKGKYPESARTFEEYLKVNPDSAKTHLELATLYDDNLKDSLLAVYHYRRYLELEPNSQEKDNIETWLKGAEKEYYDHLKMNYIDSDLKKELEALRDREKRYVALLTQLKKENDNLKSQLNMKTATSSDVQELKLKDASPAEIAVPVTPPEPKKKEIPEFYVIKQGDTLTKISRDIFGDIKYYKLILDANKDILSSETQVQIGQKLKIPKLPEKPRE